MFEVDRSHLVTDSTPKSERLMVELERLHFGLPSPLAERVNALMELALKSTHEHRPNVVDKLNEFISTNRICFQFEDGTISRRTFINQANDSVQFGLTGLASTATTKGLNHHYQVIPLPMKDFGRDYASPER